MPGGAPRCPRCAGTAEGSDFLSVCSRQCRGWVLPVPWYRTAAVSIGGTGGSGSCAVSRGLRGRGRFPSGSCRMIFPGQICSRVSGGVSRPCAGIVTAGGDTLPGLLVPSPMLWDLLVEALGSLLSCFFPPLPRFLALPLTALLQELQLLWATCASAGDAPGP